MSRDTFLSVVFVNLETLFRSIVHVTTATSKWGNLEGYITIVSNDNAEVLSISTEIDLEQKSWHYHY